MTQLQAGNNQISPERSRERDYAIEAVSLSKTYGPVQAVKEVNLKVERGQIYALLGPNGAGKTTTINMLTTLSPPTGGKAWVAGFNVVGQAAEVRERIGVTFQEAGLDKNLSGYALLDVHGRLYGLSKTETRAKIRELVQLVELDEAIFWPARNYSGGMKRRLELARGLMTSPEVLFLDEPTIGLDPQNRDRIWEYIQRLKQESGLTILITTHYMDEAEKLADCVSIIDDGRIIVEGTPAELIATIGSDVVRISGTGSPAQFIEVLTTLDWVAYAEEVSSSEFRVSSSGDEGQSSKAEEVQSLGEAIKADDAELETKTVQIGLNGEAGRSLKPIVNLAEQKGFAVGNISIKRPSLNDVFLKYTGRRLRDE